MVAGLRHLPLRPVQDARAGVLDRHATADGQRDPARRLGLLLHPHGPDRPVPAHARQDRLLSDGMGRQRSAHRATGPELLRCPVRSLTRVRPGVRPRCSRSSRRPTGCHLPAEFHRALRAADRRGRGGVRDAFPPARLVGGLDADVSDHRRARAPRLATRVSPASRTGGGLSGRGAHDVGRRLPNSGRAGRDRRPGDRGDVPSRAVRSGRRLRVGRDRDVPTGAHPRVRRPGRESVRRTVPVARRLARRDAIVRGRGTDRRAPVGRSRERDRHRHDLHLRRHHRRDLVAS